MIMKLKAEARAQGGCRTSEEEEEEFIHLGNSKD
jgi:hypothetical protein